MALPPLLRSRNPTRWIALLGALWACDDAARGPTDDARLPDAAPADATIDATVDAFEPIPCSHGPATVLATVGEPALLEVSGLAVSRQSPGVFWMHTDSGGAPILYAADTDGAPLGRVHLPGPAVDYEDLAVARCPGDGGWCLWLADSGDNLGVRPSAVVYAVREPPVDGAFGDRDADIAARYVVSFPGGPLDVEALAVSRDGQRFWLFEKTEGDTPCVFEWRTRDPGPGRLTEVACFEAPGLAVPMGKMVTAADLDGSGRRLAVRVYTGSYLYPLPAPNALDALGEVDPILVSLGPLAEPQGEAIAFDADERSLWTVSESMTPEQPLHHYPCR